MEAETVRMVTRSVHHASSLSGSLARLLVCIVTALALGQWGCTDPTEETRSIGSSPGRRPVPGTTSRAPEEPRSPALPGQTPSDPEASAARAGDRPSVSRGPVKEGKTAPHIARATPGTTPLPRAGQGPRSEALDGYLTPAEYLTIDSRHVPGAVVAIMLPTGYDAADQKDYPLVIAFGGAGECAKPPKQGALAWMHYYRSDEAVRALDHGNLTTRDFRGLVTPHGLADFNQRLKDRPYQGVILACPASPLLSAMARPEFPEYEAFVIQELVPALKKRYRVAKGRVGVDGVSMGGTRSMYYGFKYPELFASIGSVQGAFGAILDTYRDLIHKNRAALKDRSIQLVTSDADVMAPSVERLHRLLEEEGIPHAYLKLTGPHDYIFNQGPGALALLLFHSQAIPPPALDELR